MRIALLILLLSLSARTEDAPLTLRQVYELALERSEQLKIGEADWRAAEARYRRALAGSWPEIRMQGRGDIREGVNRASEVYAAGVGASWTLFDGFQADKAAKARRAEGAAIQFETERERQLLYGDVATSCYEVLAREGEIAALKDQRQALDGRIRELEHRLSIGRSRKAELLSAQAQQAELDADIARALSLGDSARELITFLTGLQSFSLAPPTELPPAEEMAVVLAPSDQRPDLLSAAYRAQAARYELNRAAAARLPRMTADGNVYLWRDPSNEDSWDIGLRIELPLFDRGARKAAIAENQENVRIQELRLQELQRKADRDVRLALRDVQGSLSQWVALQRAISITDENWRQQQQEYEMGRSSNLDVMVALTQMHGLRRREVVQAMQVRAALIRLQVAAGKIEP